MILKDKKVLITGGTRGLGLGLVEAFESHGANIYVVARGTEGLEAVRSKFGVHIISGDITDEHAASHILSRTNPDITILNAGMPPPMAPLDKMNWTDFSATWENDVKAGFYWLQAALQRPLDSGSRVLVMSSGAGHAGSPLSGGYAGAKRMLWFMAKYANDISIKRKLGIRFQTVLPMQMVGGTGVGEAGSRAYSEDAGVDQATFLARFGTPMSPLGFGEKVLSLLQDVEYAGGFAFGVRGDGITILEQATP